MSTIGGPRLSTIPTFINTYSMDFDGVDDYVNCGVVSDLVSSSAFSLSAWFYFTASAATGKTFYSYGGANQYSITVQTFSGGNILFVIANAITDDGSNYILTNLTTPLTTGEWYNIICTFDGSQAGNTDKAKIYINGTEATYGGGGGTIPATTTASAGSFNIGQWELGGSNRFFPGNIDEVAIYNYPLTAADALAIGGTVPTDLNLLATPPTNWYRMGDNGLYKDPQWLLPNNENKDKVSNYSFEFDGIDAYIELGSIPHLQNTTEYSVSSWFKSPLNNLYQVIWGWFDGADGYLQLLLISDGSFVVYNYRTSTAYGLSATGLVSADTWYNALVVFDGSGATNADRLKLYINGNLTTLTYTGTIPTQTGTMLQNGLHFGAYVTTSGTMTWELEGNIDEVSIFDSAISIGDVWDGSGEPTDVSAVSGLANYYKMGEEATLSGGVWTVPDQVGSNDGTSNAMTIEDRVGEAPNSDNNALSYNMDLVDRTTDIPT